MITFHECSFCGKKGTSLRLAPAAVSASVSESSSRVSRVSTAVRRPTAVRTAVRACPTLISSLPVCDHARNDYTDVLRYLAAAERIHGRPPLPHSGGGGRRRVRRNERRDHPTPARYLAEKARADLRWVNRFRCRAVHWLGLVAAGMVGEVLGGGGGHGGDRGGACEGGGAGGVKGEGVLTI